MSAKLPVGQLLSQTEFKLLRLILIDSYSPGGEVIIDLSNGAIVTGENGSGKTSLLRLIPIFYGENPGETIVGTESFADFYLPRLTSYIIFEYQRRDLVCMAALYASESQKYAFRFIRSSYNRYLFTTDSDKTLISYTDLKAHLKTQGAQHSRELNVSEYRAIIQGRVTTGKDMSIQRGMVAEYSFTSSGKRLDHIEKIVSGMFQRKANFDDLLRMVVGYISGHQSGAISLLGDRVKIGAWPEHFNAYQEVMQHADRMGEIEVLDAKLKANDHELQCLHAKFMILLRYYVAEIKILNEQLMVVGDKFAKAEAEYHEKAKEIQAKESKADSDADQLELRVKQLNDKDTIYRQENITVKAELVAKLSDLKNEYAELSTRKQTLLGEQNRIDQEYAALKMRVEKHYLDEQKKSLANHAKTRTYYEPLFQRQREEQQAEESGLQEEASAQTAKINAQRDTAIREQASWEGVVTNPPADSKAVASLESKQRERTQLQQGLRTAEDKRRVLEGSKYQALQRYTSQDNKAGSLRQQSKAKQTEIDRLMAYSNPVEESLLRFFRRNRPDWGMDVAKVIREDLLARTDLLPSIADDLTRTLYGVSLDVSRIDATLSSDETRLQEAISEQQEALVSISQQLNEAETLLVKCNDERRTTEDELQLQGLEIEKILSKDKTLLAEENTARRSIEESKQLSKKDAVEKMHHAEKQINKYDSQIKELRTALASELNDCRDRYVKLKQKLEQQQTTALREIEDSLKAEETRKDQKLDELEKERQQALSKKGIDVDSLKKIENELISVEAKINEATDWADRVADWRRWIETDWSHRAHYTSEAASLRKEEQEHREKRENLAREWAEHHTAVKAEIKSINDDIQRTIGIQNDVQLKINAFAEYPADAATLSIAYDTAWSSDGLFLQARILFNDKKVALEDLKTRVRVIKSSFQSTSGSPTDQYFQTIQAAVRSDDNDPRVWVEPFRKWFNGVHKEDLRVLLINAKTYAGQIEKFYSDITAFHRDVQQFNRDIQRALNRTIVFKRISRVSIEFLSAIDKLKYWNTIKDFIENHRLWINSLSNELPPSSFADGIKRLMEHWEVREGLREERRSLIDVRGEAVENGKLKIFVTAKDLENLSSTGLSYLILCTIFVAFIQMIRGSANVQVTWAVDELLDLDIRNIGVLQEMLRQNNIVLVSACPDADIDVLLQFPKYYKIIRTEHGPEVAEPEIDMGGGAYV